MSNQLDLYPRRRTAVRKYTSRYLKKDPALITYADVDQFKSFIYDQIHVQNLSPQQIMTKYSLFHSNFSTFVRDSLGIPLKDHTQALKNLARQNGTIKTDAKSIYYAACEFKFSQQEVVRIPGFELIKRIGIYHPTKNPTGAVRDHILSRAEAYREGYNPDHIRHPANCRFITFTENNKKNQNSDITYEELLDRIADWDKNTLPLLQIKRRKIPKSQEHIEKIRHAIKERYRKMDAGELPNLKRKSKKIL